VDSARRRGIPLGLITCVGVAPHLLDQGDGGAAAAVVHRNLGVPPTVNRVWRAPPAVGLWLPRISWRRFAGHGMDREGAHRGRGVTTGDAREKKGRNRTDRFVCNQWQVGYF
jgi:hypothetical protein